MKNIMSKYVLAGLTLTLIISLAVSFYLTRVNTTGSAKPKNTFADLTARNVELYFTPREFNGINGDTIRILPVVSLTGQNNVGFIQLAITFDRTYLQFINSDEQTVTPGFTYFRSEESNPNQTGNLILTYGADEGFENSENSINLSTLSFVIINEQPLENPISFDLVNSQIVFRDQIAAYLSVNSKVVLNMPVTIQPTVETLLPSATPTQIRLKPTRNSSPGNATKNPQPTIN